MGFMDVAKKIGNQLGKHKPLATALLLVAMTALTVGFLSWEFSAHGPHGARPGYGIHARFGHTAMGNPGFDGMQPMHFAGWTEKVSAAMTTHRIAGGKGMTRPGNTGFWMQQPHFQAGFGRAQP